MRFEELASGCSLLEAPVWDGAGGVYFSDVLKGGVRRWSASGGIEEVLPKRRGIGGMCLHADGGLVVSGRDVLHVRGGEQRVLLEASEGVAGFNDLGTDGEGRLYAGVLRFRPFAGESPVPGQVVQIGDGETVIVLDGIDWPNGIAFSPDWSTMYACDYAHGTVLTPGGVFARSPAGSADGLAIDEEGGVWVATGEAAAIVRFAPDGSVDRSIDVPTDFVSSLCFGGDDMRDVYVTTVGALLNSRSDVPGLPVPPADV